MSRRRTSPTALTPFGHAMRAARWRGLHPLGLQLVGWGLLALLGPAALVGTAHAEPVHAWLDPTLLRADIATYGRDSEQPWVRVKVTHQGRDFYPVLAARWAFTGKNRASDSTTRPRNQLRWEEAVMCRFRMQSQPSRHHIGIMFTPSSKYWKDNAPYRYACISLSPNAGGPEVVQVHPSTSANRVQILYTTMRWHDGAWVPRADHRIRHANTLPSRQWLSEDASRRALNNVGITGDQRRPCLVERQVGKDGSTPLFEFAPGYTHIVNGNLRCSYKKLIEDKPGWQKSIKWDSAYFTTPRTRFRLFRDRNL